jgi:zinc transport system permease protein
MARIADGLFTGINMLEIFQYSFMVRAFIAGGIIAVIAPLIGTFLVAKRYSLMADSLAHVSLAGVAFGLLFGVYPVLTAIIVTIITAIIIEILRTKKGISGEIALAMFLSGGLSVAIVLIGLGKGFSVDLFSYLFGSITTVTITDLWIIGGLGIVVIATIVILYKEFVYIAFDEDAARVSGVNAGKLNIILMVLTAVTVSLSLRIVGTLLIGALMVIPVVSAMQLKRSFRDTILAAIIYSLTSVFVGLTFSYYLGLAAGGIIVVTALVLFGATILFGKK